jgi:pimeloyl-ACP methyl ester carboxylesterase
MIGAVDEQFDMRGKLWERVEFFDSPTVGALADILVRCEAGGNRALSEAGEKCVEDLSAVLLQSLGSGPPIFFFPGERMNPWYLRHLVRNLGKESRFIVLLHELTHADRFDEFASRAVSLIQKISTSGPLVLVGHCYGGILAYEAAQRLIANGRSGTSLVLIDTPAPGYPKIRLRRYVQSVPAAIRILLRGGAHSFANEIAGHIRLLRKRRLRPPGASRVPASSMDAPQNPVERRAISDSAVSPAGSYSGLTNQSRSGVALPA